jgi:hypothetical protein
MKAWEIVDNTTDERIKLQALALIKECDSSRLEMVTNGTVVSDALKYVNGKAEKLKLESESESKESEEPDYGEEEELEEGQEKDTGELEDKEEKTTNNVF